MDGVYPWFSYRVQPASCSGTPWPWQNCLVSPSPLRTPGPPLRHPWDDCSRAAGSLPAPLHQLRLIAPAAINNADLPFRSSHDVPWDAEAWLPCDSAPATGTLPVPGVLACLWPLSEKRGWAGDNREVALPCLYSCAEPRAGYVPHPQGWIWGRNFREGDPLVSFVCKKMKNKQKKRRWGCVGCGIEHFLSLPTTDGSKESLW